ncbi:MAG: YicC/YloC family endoribonuclease [Desulfobacterales bacterium]|jgi:uncharacterized protein (TIGR00255 family)
MINSMTAFARAEQTVAALTVCVEIRTYNSRHLDVVLRLPHGYHPLEEKIRACLSRHLARGRVELKLTIRDASEAANAYEVNLPKASAYCDALRRMKAAFDLQGDVRLELLAASPDLIKPAEVARDLEMDWAVIGAAIDQALEALVAMRRAEGGFLAGDFQERLARIEAWLEQIAQASGGLLDHYQTRLKERIAALTKGLVEIDPARIAQETAFLADRSDISEEIVRARSHIQQFRSVMAAAEPGGRKLNFLLQEFSREFNTMGSKTEKASVAHLVVDVKCELEKIREQVQNVE